MNFRATVQDLHQVMQICYFLQIGHCGIDPWKSSSRPRSLFTVTPKVGKPRCQRLTLELKYLSEEQRSLFLLGGMR